MLGATSGGAASQRALAKAKAPSAWGKRAPSEKRHAHCFPTHKHPVSRTIGRFPPIEAAFNGVPIVAFINEVFGTQLGMSFVISPGLQEKTDLVTLRLTSPVPPRQFFSTARQVLQECGAAIRERDGVPAFLTTQEIESGEVPLTLIARLAVTGACGGFRAGE